MKSPSRKLLPGKANKKEIAAKSGLRAQRQVRRRRISLSRKGSSLKPPDLKGN